MTNPVEPAFEMITQTRIMLEEYLQPTPLISAPNLTEQAGVRLLLKLEMFQPTGSFKVRGAFSKLLRMSDNQKIVTASSGNHGAATAYACQVLARDAVVVVPEGTPDAKIKNIARFDVDLLCEGETYDRAEEYARKLAQDDDLEYVSPYCDRDIIAGQGTAALEMLEQTDRLDAVIVPVGGGGLIGGMAVALKSAAPHIKVIGVQPEASCPMYRSVKEGEMVEVEHHPTLSEATAGDIPEETLDIVLRTVDDMVIVSEDEIAEAIRHLILEEKIVAEGAAALPAAAVLTGKINPEYYVGNGSCALILSGRNIDPEIIARLASVS